MLMPLDLETTGLLPTSDRILEIAWTFRYDTMEPIVNTIYSEVIRPVGYATLPQDWPEIVRDMHTDSGLLADLHDQFLPDRAQVERRIMETLDRVQAETDNEPVYLLGLSVHFDRSFLDTWMPTLARRLHHRILDVSSLKLFFDSIGVPRPEIENYHEHRAASDVQEAIDTVLAYSDLAGGAIGLFNQQKADHEAQA